MYIYIYNLTAKTKCHMSNTWESSAERLTLEPFEPHLARSRPRSRYPSEGYPPDTHFADFQKGILCFSPSVYQLVVFNLQLVSNNIATWLLTTVPGSLEQYRPPPRFVPTVQFPTLRLWHITLLPCRPCLDCLAHVLCTFWTPNPIVSAPQHSSTHHPTHVREAWTSTTPTHASFYLCTAPEQPALMLVVRPCAQRNHVCRVHSAHFFDTQDHTSAPQHRSIHLPTCLREAWTSTTPTHASFYFCTAPEQPAMMLVMLAGSAALHLPSRVSSPPTRLPSRSPPSSLPSPVPTHAPPVSLPSIFPPQPRPHPSASPPSSLPSPVPTHAPPVSLPSIFPPQPRPHPCTSRH